MVMFHTLGWLDCTDLVHSLLHGVDRAVPDYAGVNNSACGNWIDGAYHL